MAGIYERVTNPSESGETKLPVHTFMAALRELPRGNVTKAQVVSAFALDATAESELDAIIATYGALSTDRTQLEFKSQLHDALLLAESGHYDKSKVKDVLGF